MIDLSKVKAGDVVKFRCGGEAEIEDSECDYDCKLWFKNYGATHYFYKDGTRCRSKGSPFDIIEIKPKAFDWADAKPGMAFTSHGVCVLTKKRLFAAKSKTHSEIEAANEYDDSFIATLTRAPEHDKEGV